MNEKEKKSCDTDGNCGCSSFKCPPCLFIWGIILIYIIVTSFFVD